MFEALLEQERDSILIEEFLNRDWDREWKSRTLTSARKFYETGGDLLEEEKTKFLGMDYGFRRKPLKPTTTSQHLASQTSLFVSGLWRCRLIDCPIAGTSDEEAKDYDDR